MKFITLESSYSYVFNGFLAFEVLASLTVSVKSKLGNRNSI